VATPAPSSHAGEMRSLARAVATLGSAALILGACGADPSAQPVPEEETASSPAPSSATPADAVGLAVVDLATREGVDRGDIEVVSAEEVTWRDGSLGCAKPEMAYTQALVPGTRIRLRLGGRQYDYHAGGGTAPFHCDRPTG